MSPNDLLWALTWLAIVVVFLGFTVLLGEVRRLRAEVARLSQTSSTPLPALPAALTDKLPRVVLAASSGCPLCRLALDRLVTWAPRLSIRPVLLTDQGAQLWDQVPETVELVSDRVAWQRISHLSPPVLMALERDGGVVELVLPATGEDVDDALTRWARTGVIPGATAG